MMLKQYEDYTAEEIISEIANNFAADLGFSKDFITDMLSQYKDDKEGLLKTLRDQRYFEKPCVKARKKSARARIRNRSRRGRMELN